MEELCSADVLLYIYFFTSSDSQTKCKRIVERNKMLQNGKTRSNKHKERIRRTCYKDGTSKERTVLLSLLPLILKSAYTQSGCYGKCEVFGKEQRSGTYIDQAATEER
jgi:hypothetical protein